MQAPFAADCSGVSDCPTLAGMNTLDRIEARLRLAVAALNVLLSVAMAMAARVWCW